MMPHTYSLADISNIKLRKRLLDENHPDIAHTQSVLGECLGALGQYATAEPLVLKSYEKMKPAQGKKDHGAVEVLKRRTVGRKERVGSAVAKEEVQPRAAEQPGSAPVSLSE